VRRNRKTGLVPNESAILLLGAELTRLGHTVFHGYQLSSELRERPSRAMSYSTVYRCLDRLEERGLLTGHWETDDAQGPPRRVYELSADGRAKVAQLQELQEAGKANWLTS
jgi:DNA-binding PadR family transcriptional regulator